ncbi:MAG TPA: GNAT family N-acetyltransferase [Candidatus Binataceae bacterium]|nr:GNAT family N-acetyltransferase [Candidatus Binataceae bacterium]
MKIVRADLADPAHGAALVEMIDAYMRDPMELNAPAPEHVRRNLIPGLRANPSCRVLFAYRGAKPIGFAICFLGFSTFNARPLLNIHDIFVDASVRGLGIGLMLLKQIEKMALELDCCRISLEVREDNDRARGLYRKFGFDVAQLGPDRVTMEFWWKPL